MANADLCNVIEMKYSFQFTNPAFPFQDMGRKNMKKYI